VVVDASVGNHHIELTLLRFDLRDDSAIARLVGRGEFDDVYVGMRPS
jgi:hypothetical protein